MKKIVIKINGNIFSCNILFFGPGKITRILSALAVTFPLALLFGCAAEFSTVADEREDIGTSTGAYLDEDHATSSEDTSVDDSADSDFDTATEFDIDDDTDDDNDTDTDTALVGQLGILDLDANGGNNPATGFAWELGDTYRFAFVTSKTTDAISTDIADYNAFVQSVADESTLGLDGISWKCLGSTPFVDAKVNTASPASGTSTSIFLLDGSSIVATNYVDLWDGSAGAIYLDEKAAATADGVVFTGSDVHGVAWENAELGHVGEVAKGYATTNDWRWFGAGSWGGDGWLQHNENHFFYAISEVLKIEARSVAHSGDGQ